MYGLCDCNNFFVSCERVFRPDLNGKPVVVLSNNDGCIVARSNEAKALGIKMGQPLYQIKNLIKSAGVTYFSSNYALYGDMSSRVFQIVKQNAPSVEIYSIDEAFMDLSGIDQEELKDYGKELVRKIRKCTGIPVSIGVAHTKTLAKIASRLCKKYPKFEGCCVMTRPQDIQKVLSSYPIEDVWGIGRRYAKMLNDYQIKTAEQFTRLPAKWVKEKMSIVGLRTWQELRGEACIEFDAEEVGKKTITVSRSFAKELTTIADLDEAITTFIATGARKLRSQGSVAAHMQVYIMTNRHREDKAQHQEGELIVFSNPTDNSIELVKQGRIALKKIFREGYEYKKAGVLFSGLRSKGAHSPCLFEEEPTVNPKQDLLMSTLDELAHRYGRSAVKLGNELDIAAKSNHESLSKEYTTSWNDILVVKTSE